MAKSIADLLLGKIFDKAVETVIANPKVADSQAVTVAADVVDAIRPTVTNATNSEPLYQSRVAIGSMVPILAAISDLASMYASKDWDQQRIITDLVILSGAAFALYGRIFGARLKPIGG